MKYVFCLALLVLSTSLYSPLVLAQEATFGGYVLSEQDHHEENYTGAGFSLASDVFNLKLEATSQRYGLSTVCKFSLLNENLYVKLGGAVTRDEFSADNSSLWVNQYSAGLAAGHMIADLWYVEAGSLYTNLPEETFSNGSVFLDETTIVTYVEAVKRFNIGRTILDVSGDYSVIHYNHNDDENSFGGGIDFYPTEAIKISAYLRESNGYVHKPFSVTYKGLFAEYVDLPDSEFRVNVGVQFAWGGGDGISVPQNLVAQISGNQRFEDGINNLIYLRSRGVQTAAIE